MGKSLQLSYDRDALCKAIPIEDVIQLYAGIRTDRRGNISCPSPNHADKHPSTKIFHDSNTCFCFSCKKSYDPVSLAFDYNPNLSTPELYKKLTEDFGIPLESVSNIQQVREVEQANREKRFIDVFPLSVSECKRIGLDGVLGAVKPDENREDDDKPPEVQERFPSLMELWKTEKAAVESLLIAKCDDTLDDLKSELNWKTEHFLSVYKDFTPHSADFQEAQRIHEAVERYKSTDTPVKVNMMSKHDDALYTKYAFFKDSVDDLKQLRAEMSSVLRIKEKVLSQQKERQKEQFKGFHKKKTTVERD